MTWDEQLIAGVYLVTPTVHHDNRGFFFESFKESALLDKTQITFDVAQVNTSHSVKNTVRGIHYTHSAVGQAKYVSCSTGQIIDVVLDIRVGSPTFGQHLAVTLSAENQQSLYIPEGLGHAFWVTSEEARVTYLCSSEYDPKSDRAINALDPALKLPWQGVSNLVLSEKDLAAPLLRDCAVNGLLPMFSA